MLLHQNNPVLILVYKVRHFVLYTPKDVFRTLISVNHTLFFVFYTPKEENQPSC